MAMRINPDPADNPLALEEEQPATPLAVPPVKLPDTRTPELAQRENQMEKDAVAEIEKMNLPPAAFNVLLYIAEGYGMDEAAQQAGVRPSSIKAYMAVNEEYFDLFMKMVNVSGVSAMVDLTGLAKKIASRPSGLVTPSDKLLFQMYAKIAEVSAPQYFSKLLRRQRERENIDAMREQDKNKNTGRNDYKLDVAAKPAPEELR